MISYSGSKLFWTSTPRPFDGRSLICPIEAFTTKSLPRYLLIVFALAGDSTMTKFLGIYCFAANAFFLPKLYPARYEREFQNQENNFSNQAETTALAFR